jgi:Flp pilus assembly protein TadD
MTKFRTISVAFAGLLISTAAWAVDTPSPSDLPDLTKIKAQDYKTAITELLGLVDKGFQDPNVYNLLGFSLPKSGHKQGTQTFNNKALAFDPNHKGTLEYQGEFYTANGDIPKAQQNLARLKTLCPNGCEKREDLERPLSKVAESR